MIYRILNLLFFFLATMEAYGQGAVNSIEMADKFRQDGKIYVVVATVMLILAGLFAFLIWLERRIENLEQKQK